MKYRAYIDIETTGLSRHFADLTVVGIALEKGGQCGVVQLLEAGLSERRLLAALQGVDEIYSYNGSRFDLPFIRARLGVDLRACFKHTDLWFDRLTTLSKVEGVNGPMGVIFDLDGVLVDTGWAHRQAWYDLAEREGFKMSDELFTGTFGMQNYQILPMLAGRELSSEEIDQLADWKEQRYRELMAEKLALPPGGARLLDELKDAGFLLAIGSSAPKANLDLVLERLRLHHYFDVYVTKEDVTNGKPAPDTFLTAAEKLALPPQRCVVVEDAVQGVEAAKAAGMPVIAMTTTRDRSALSRADMIADSLGELKAEDFKKLLMRVSQ